MEIEVEDPGPFKVLYELPPDTNMVIIIGGRGGKKTYETSKFITFASTIKKKRCCILRDEKEKIRESILNEIFQRYDTANEYGHFNALYDKIDSGVRDKSTNQMLIFTQGFRASSKDKKSNLKGASAIDIAVVEEAEDIVSFTKFNTFKDSMRTKGRLVIVLLNTPDVGHWIVEKYFDLDPVLDDEGKATGYFKLVPKKIRGFVAIQTSYKDNQHLPEDVVRDYEGYGDPKSHLYDLHYYYTQILGYTSSGRKGQIYTKFKKISLKDYEALPYKEIFGLDFGTASPAALIGVKLHRNQVYAREYNYLPKDILPIGKLLCQLKIGDKDIIIADSAEPLSINKLRNGWEKDELDADDLEKYPQLLRGFYILGALKPPGSVVAGISMVKSKEVFIVDESKNMWMEVSKYIYDTDRFDNPLDEPLDEFNHTLDPLRYVVTGEGKLF